MQDVERSAHLLGELVGLALRSVTVCPMELNLLTSERRSEAGLGKTPAVLHRRGRVPFGWRYSKANERDVVSGIR